MTGAKIQEMRRDAALCVAAMNLSNKEWRYIVALLETEHECNENPLAASAIKKLAPVADVLTMGFK